MTTVEQRMARVLINLPPQDRIFVQREISPTTFRRWCLQTLFGAETHSGLMAKISRLRRGQEKISGYAKMEKKHEDLKKAA